MENNDASKQEQDIKVTDTNKQDTKAASTSSDRRDYSGIYLDGPVSSRHIQRKQAGQLNIGCVNIHGRAAAIEDAYSIESIPRHPDATFVGVYSGNNEGVASLYCSTSLSHFLNDVSDLANANQISEAMLKADDAFAAYNEALTAFGIVERGDTMNDETDLNVHFKMGNADETGSTYLFAIIQPLQTETKRPSTSSDSSNDKPKTNTVTDSTTTLSRSLKTDTWAVTIASAGNSKVFVIHADGTFDCPIRTSHTPNDATERARIENAGGFIEDNHLDGKLSRTRGIGNYLYKRNAKLSKIKQKVIAVPDVTTIRVTTGDVLLLVGDGLHRGMTPEDITSCVFKKCQQRTTLQLEDAVPAMCELLGKTLNIASITFSNSFFSFCFSSAD